MRRFARCVTAHSCLAPSARGGNNTCAGNTSCCGGECIAASWKCCGDAAGGPPFGCPENEQCGMSGGCVSNTIAIKYCYKDGCTGGCSVPNFAASVCTTGWPLPQGMSVVRRCEQG
jgi:hypothetical protein